MTEIETEVTKNLSNELLIESIDVKIKHIDEHAVKIYHKITNTEYQDKLEILLEKIGYELHDIRIVLDLLREREQRRNKENNQLKCFE